MQNKIQTYPPLTHAEDLKQICQPLNTLGINYFAYVHVDKQNQFSAIGQKPEFVRLYLEKEYYNYDIHMAKANGNESFVLWDFMELDKQSKEMDDDCHAFGIYHSFTMIQQGERGKEYFHFGADSGSNINNTYLQQIDTLKRFVLHFKEKINDHKQLIKSYDYKFSIADDEADFFTKDYSDDVRTEIQVNRIFIKDLGVYLTQREFQCLHWLSLAKTIDQIAVLMNITPRTVKAHIANIKEKTSYGSLFQLGTLYQQLQDWAY